MGAACVLQVSSKCAAVACNSLTVTGRAKTAWTMRRSGFEHGFGIRCVVACSCGRDLSCNNTTL
jgi:hypothetical protein